jgi:hypothetical protein
VVTATEYLVEYGEAIGYALVGLLALIVLGVVQLIRRRRDLERARVAVRLVTYSICEPREGPVAVTGTYRESPRERWIECKAQRVSLADGVDVVRGTRAHWHRGTRTYALRDGDVVIAIGVMSRIDRASWRIVPSPGEAGVQLYAVAPMPAPAPLWPWRAPLVLAMAGGVAFFGLAKLGELVVEQATCAEPLPLQIAAALPLVRDDALAKLQQCPSPR